MLLVAPFRPMMLCGVLLIGSAPINAAPDTFALGSDLDARSLRTQYDTDGRLELSAVRVAEHLCLGGRGPVAIRDSGLHSLRLSGVIDGDVFIDNVDFATQIVICDAHVHGQITIRNSRFGCGLIIEASDAFDLTLEENKLGGEALDLDDLSLRSLHIDGLEHAVWTPATSPMSDTPARHFAGITARQVKVRDGASFSRIILASLEASIEVGGEFKWDGNSVSRIDMQCSRISGPAQFAFESVPEYINFSNASFGSGSKIEMPFRIPPGTHAVNLSRSDLEFGELPKASDFVPMVERGTPVQYKRAALIRLMRVYRNVGYTLDAMEVHRAIARHDLGTGPGAMLRYLPSGVGGENRMLWIWLALTSAVAGYLVIANNWWCCIIREGELRSEYSRRATRFQRVADAMLVAVDSVSPFSLRYKLELLAPAQVGYVAGKLGVWIILLVLAQSLSGYF